MNLTFSGYSYSLIKPSRKSSEWLRELDYGKVYQPCFILGKHHQVPASACPACCEDLRNGCGYRDQMDKAALPPDVFATYCQRRKHWNSIEWMHGLSLSKRSCPLHISTSCYSTPPPVFKLCKIYWMWAQEVWLANKCSEPDNSLSRRAVPGFIPGEKKRLYIANTCDLSLSSPLQHQSPTNKVPWRCGDSQSSAFCCNGVKWYNMIQHDTTACCRLLFDLFVACKIRQLSWSRTGTWGCSGIEPARASSTAGASCRDVPLLLWGTYRLGYCLGILWGSWVSFQFA